MACHGRAPPSHAGLADRCGAAQGNPSRGAQARPLRRVLGIVFSRPATDGSETMDMCCVDLYGYGRDTPRSRRKGIVGLGPYPDSASDSLHIECDDAVTVVRTGTPLAAEVKVGFCRQFDEETRGIGEAIGDGFVFVRVAKKLPHSNDIWPARVRPRIDFKVRYATRPLRVAKTRPVVGHEFLLVATDDESREFDHEIGALIRRRWYTDDRTRGAMVSVAFVERLGSHVCQAQHDAARLVAWHSYLVWRVPVKGAYRVFIWIIGQRCGGGVVTLPGHPEAVRKRTQLPQHRVCSQCRVGSVEVIECLELPNTLGHPVTAHPAFHVQSMAEHGFKVLQRASGHFALAERANVNVQVPPREDALQGCAFASNV